MDIKNKAIQVIINRFPEIGLDENFYDSGAGSLDMMELVMDLEDAFNINIPDKLYETVKTPQDIIRMIEVAIDNANDTCE